MFNSQTLIRPRLASRLEKPNELWTVPGLLAYRPLRTYRGDWLSSSALATATPIVVYEVSPEVHGELVSVTARNVRMGGLPISISHLPRFRVWTPEA
ncbi:hypothetical protein NLI96_g4511 [Meripilus lineatus]|uniref:Uncharacterized protein n=1 Tax=Meripilus lineatus TaxID=2056292 RepID=A0AAD5V4R9_9APHY|nr:hypothetical protein NLI96_g4511 [Physisporinus lineatus]